MHYASAAIAVFGLATLSQAHMEMSTPVPMGLATLNNSPLAADGSDFPCKLRTGTYAVTTVNTMALGSTQPLTFIGSATHGGGSCQISITYDAAPTKDSVFKVIHSIEGGCPIQGVAGNNGDSASAVDPSTYSFKIPSTLPTGNATLAWTWFNKVGNREMYMNCAAIDITGSSTKRQELVERDQAAFNALPDMFTANIGNGCATVDSADVIFPNPGDSLEQLGTATSTALSSPVGSCGTAATGVVSASTGTGGATTTAAASKATSSAIASSAPAVSGGVFITVATSAVAGTTAPVATSSPKATSAASAATSVEATSVASSTAPASTGTSASGTAIAAGTACTTEGEWNCIGGTSFQQCASGTWSAVQSVAAGTTCSGGESTNLSIAAIAQKRGEMVDSFIDATKRRAIRFSGEHLHRHRMSN